MMLRTMLCKALLYTPAVRVTMYLAIFVVGDGELGCRNMLAGCWT